ncbi:gene transfer agent family protein, partial [Rhizobiaceae sp. 2RAB30]
NGGEHLFRLGLEEIYQLEAETDMSVFVSMRPCRADVPFARLKHYSATIRLGLVGGDMPAP